MKKILFTAVALLILSAAGFAAKGLPTKQSALTD
jgi:hypothetical protein